ncbi:MAG: hypothetical protein K5766_01660 [Alphaproteobacteria bacterium]|nr:hypothetical protein [Alphaproteobacteria bacterium]
MTDETRKSVKKSNKIEKEEKHSILIRILTTFVTTLRFLNQKIKFSVYLFLNLKNFFSFRRFTSGYVLILTVVALPVLLYGAKYLLDHRTLLDRKVMDSSLEGKRLVKFCAKDAAQAVAAKWNPALTYKQQREAMLRITDEIYNASPTYEISLVTQALHGIDIPKEVISKGGAYDPIKITRTLSDEGLSPSLKQIARTSQTTSMNRYYFYYFYSTYRAPMALYHFYIMYNSFKRENANLFPPDEDLYTDYTYYCSNTSDPFGKGWYHYVTWPEVVGMFDKDGSPSVGTKSYTTRTDLDDETVKIEIEDDKIKVTTDDDVAYAVPEECNVDIILTVPTNSAAMNPDNLDKNTVTSGTPYISTSKTPTDEAKSTPIYQITRAYQKFLKENFFYTRGVNVGVIPYSGKVSLRKDRSNWVKDPDTFVPDYFLDGSSPPMIMGSMMYGTYGTAGADLTSIGNYAGVNQSPTIYGYGLLCRGETQSYNGNTITLGDLLSTENPKNYKFRRMIYNPCYAGYANLLSMKCEKDCNKHWMNPYFILELNPDVKFIYNMLGAFYPYYDDRNVSNFIFIPVTWANNLLQSWNATGKNSAVDTSDDSENLGRLSTPSKMTPGRRKALILIVNKPDWFEPGELTYLGFDNDFSEIPMYESDTISGEIDYSDTTQKFADGSSYDGTIQGAKKILKLKKVSGDDFVRKNGFYECKNGKYRLTFPQKQTIKLQVDKVRGGGQGKFVAVSDRWGGAAYSTDGINWTNSNLPSDTGWRSVCYGDGKFVVSSLNQIAYSEDGINWNEANVPHDDTECLVPICYEGGKFVAPGVFSFDGINWTRNNLNNFSHHSICYGNGKFLMTDTSNYRILYSTDGINWDGYDFYEWESQSLLYYANDKFILVYDGTVRGSSTDGINWTMIDELDDDCISLLSVCYGDGKFVAVSDYGNDAAYSSDGINWKKTPFSDSFFGEPWVCYGNGKFVTVSREGIVAYSSNGINWENAIMSGISGNTWSSVCYGGGGDSSGSLQFTSSSVLSDTEKKTITSDETFIITPDKINGDSDGEYFIEFEMENIKLISAEITNRPYVTVTPIVATYVNNVKYTNESDSITFSSGATAGSNGYLSYSTTSGTTTYDSLGRVCEGSATGRLYFPHKGQVTLKVAPVGKGSVTFYGDNEIADNVGTHMIDEEKMFTFTGGQEPSGRYIAVNSTCGPNFGHNLSLYKVRYSCRNCHISSATLTNQWIRDYTGQYSRGADTNYKPLILSDGTLAKQSGSEAANTYNPAYTYGLASGEYIKGSEMYNNLVDIYLPRFRDPCYSVWNIYGIYMDERFAEYRSNGGRGNNYECRALGTQGNCLFCVLGKNKRTYLYINPNESDTDYGNNKTAEHWSNYSLNLPLNAEVMFMRVGFVLQHYLRNGVNKTLQSTSPYSSMPTGLSENEGIYLVNLDTNLSDKIVAGEYICFNGDGELSVTVTPVTAAESKIAFTNILNEETITEEKTYTFTSDQISGGSDGNYYIEFDMDDIKMVSASYSYSSMEADGTTTESVYDVIDFASGFNGKNGILSASSDLNGSVSNGLYVVNSTRSDIRITSTRKGNISLVVAPTIESKRGAINYFSNGYYYGIGISSKKTITIGAEELVSSGFSYYVDIGAERVVILYAKWEPISEKLQLPKRSRVIDFSQNPLDTNEISVNSEFYNHWEYNTNNGYWTNTDSTGDGLFGNYYPSGDYTVIGYGDKSYDALRYHANGTISDNNNTYWKYDMFKTAGLNRIFVDWEDKPTIADYTIRWPKYKNDNPGSLYWMMGTMTLPINASLWVPIGAFERQKLENSESAVYYDSHYQREELENSESAVYYDSHYQLDKEGNYNIVQSASGVAMSITSDACSKLKEDWGEDLRIYVIKYRKQTKYKIETGVELDYFYNNLRSCVSYPQQWKEPYVYDISTPDELNDALEKIAQDIKNWPDIWQDVWQDIWQDIL